MKKQLIYSFEKKVFTLFVAFVLIFGDYAKTFAAPDGSANMAKSSYNK